MFKRFKNSENRVRDGVLLRRCEQLQRYWLKDLGDQFDDRATGKELGEKKNIAAIRLAHNKYTRDLIKPWSKVDEQLGSHYG